jgi:hypothetical protein
LSSRPATAPRIAVGESVKKPIKNIQSSVRKPGASKKTGS